MQRSLCDGICALGPMRLSLCDGFYSFATTPHSMSAAAQDLHVVAARYWSMPVLKPQLQSAV
jgi:hypothetical protein